jgi:glucose/mannose-6-phosphate isomerase
MMKLDDLQQFDILDPQDMLGHINGLPDQLLTALELANGFTLPDWQGLQSIVFAGMGGSAIGADLVAAYVLPFCPTPVFVHRDYDLPGFASGPNSLVVCSSHSGNTEETLSSYQLALERGCRLMVIATGGKLGELSRKDEIPFWQFNHSGQPRSAVGYSFGLLLALLVRLKCIPDQTVEVQRAVGAMKSYQEHLRPEVPTAKNPAKRYAGQLMGRIVTIMASGALVPVARRWKGQINEIAKSAAQFESLPEADHNTLQGLSFPENTLNAHSMTLFLNSPTDHQRNRLRSDLTRKAFMLEGLGTDSVNARGDSRLSQIWTLILFGDYISYYLAIAYEIDPTPIPALENFKRALKEAN